MTPCGISCVTTLPAPMIESSPMRTPGTTLTLPQIQTLFPMEIGLGISPPAARSSASVVWLPENIPTFGPINVLLPILTCPQSRITQPKLM